MCNVCLDRSVLRLHPTLVFSHLHTILMHLCDCMPGSRLMLKSPFRKRPPCHDHLFTHQLVVWGVEQIVTETSWLESTGVCTCCVRQNQADGSFARQKFNVRTLLVRTVKKETLLVFKCLHRTVMTNTLFSEWCGYQSLSNSTLNE